MKRAFSETAMWQVEVPPIRASRWSKSATSGGRPSIGAPNIPRPPAWASMIATATGVPGASPKSSAAAAVSPFPNGSPMGRTRRPIRV